MNHRAQRRSRSTSARVPFVDTTCVRLVLSLCMGKRRQFVTTATTYSVSHYNLSYTRTDASRKWAVAFFSLLAPFHEPLVLLCLLLSLAGFGPKARSIIRPLVCAVQGRLPPGDANGLSTLLLLSASSPLVSTSATVTVVPRHRVQGDRPLNAAHAQDISTSICFWDGCLGGTSWTGLTLPS
jgi:hypothetical protein